MKLRPVCSSIFRLVVLNHRGDPGGARILTPTHTHTAAGPAIVSSKKSESTQREKLFYRCCNICRNSVQLKSRACAPPKRELGLLLGQHLWLRTSQRWGTCFAFAYPREIWGWLPWSKGLHCLKNRFQLAYFLKQRTSQSCHFSFSSPNKEALVRGCKRPARPWNPSGSCVRPIPTHFTYPHIWYGYWSAWLSHRWCSRGDHAQGCGGHGRWHTHTVHPLSISLRSSSKYCHILIPEPLSVLL